MACYHPIPACQNDPGGPVKLWPHLGEENMKLPCGTCIGCRTDQATRWAQRCMHEASRWDHNIFVTLTYDDAHFPQDGHLEPKELQLFLKRLRRHRDRNKHDFNSNSSSNIKFFACGEYGERYGRAHYHAIIFNLGIRDSERTGETLYTSPLIRRLWQKGEIRLGAVTGASANYVAQYSIKNQKNRPCDADGVYRAPPFLRMSRRPAIGMEWLAKYHGDLQHGYLVANNRKTAIPRAYTEKLEKTHRELAERIEYEKYRSRTRARRPHKTKEELQAAETIHKRRRQLTIKRS